ncbi:MAG: ABC transporter substrate-binding protein [Deltaproteobacteria bacterium]|nr:ABC transporter substrate-binding protein [Deltaproteobacteria bacterium]
MNRNIPFKQLLIPFFLILIFIGSSFIWLNFTKSAICFGTKTKGRYKPDVLTAKRIVSLSSAVTQSIISLNGQDNLVGIDRWSAYFFKIHDIPILSSGGSFSIELILGLNPDLIFVWRYQSQLIHELKSFKLRVIEIQPQKINQAIDLIKKVGKVIGKEEEASQIVNSIVKKVVIIKKISSKLKEKEKPLVYFELYSPFKTIGPNTFIDELLKLAGGKNIASYSLVNYPLLSSEYIIEKNPDLIIMIKDSLSDFYPDVIKNRPGWNKIRAVKKNKVFAISNELVSPGPEFIKGVIKIFEWCHPELKIRLKKSLQKS